MRKYRIKVLSIRGENHYVAQYRSLGLWFCLHCRGNGWGIFAEFGFLKDSCMCKNHKNPRSMEDALSVIKKDRSERNQKRLNGSPLYIYDVL